MRPLGLLLLMLAGFLQSSPALALGAEDEALLASLQKPGHVALMRHAWAPGTGDPDIFDIDHCDPQRNLSSQGREQAKAIGARLRSLGISKAQVYSSRWCRCLETAALLGLGPVQALAPLNSFFRAFHREAEQTEALRQWLKEPWDAGPRILVTHQVNITALTGIFPQSGEILVLNVRDLSAIEVVGRVATLED